MVRRPPRINPIGAGHRIPANRLRPQPRGEPLSGRASRSLFAAEKRLLWAETFVVQIRFAAIESGHAPIDPFSFASEMDLFYGDYPDFPEVCQPG